MRPVKIKPCLKGKPVSISVSNLPQARAFYRDVLALGEPVDDLAENDWIKFSCGSANGNLALTQAEPNWQPSSDTSLVLNNGLLILLDWA